MEAVRVEMTDSDYNMFNIFKKKATIKETTEAFPKLERIIKVGLYKKSTDWNISHGLSGEIAKIIAAQEVNYITGEDWEKNLQSATEEIKGTVAKYKSDIIPSVKAMLETDKMCREIIVNYLRIKSVLLLASLGDTYIKSDTDERIKQILSIYGSEFPEEADPIKFGNLVLDFYATLFPHQK